jgi:hypothetical protein
MLAEDHNTCSTDTETGAEASDNSMVEKIGGKQQQQQQLEQGDMKIAMGERESTAEPMDTEEKQTCKLVASIPLKTC